MNPSTAGEPIIPPPAGRYELDPARCTVVLRTRHLFGLAAVSGTLRLTDGALTVASAPPRVALSVTLDAGSLGTGSRRRDRDLHSARFLDTDRYPTLHFRADETRRDGGCWSIGGELTVRDVTAPVTLSLVSIDLTESGFRAHATARVDRYAFGVDAARGLAARHLDLDLAVTARSSRG